MEVADVSKGKRNFLMTVKVGPLPLPVYTVLAIIILTSAYIGKLPGDMIGGFAIMMILGMLLGEIGLKIPILKDVGGPAILSIFIPSTLVFYGIFNETAIKSITVLTKTSNFLYFYIACLVTGSILGMIRSTLIKGFLKLFVPLIVGTVASCIIGTLVGTMTGLGTFESFFYVVSLSFLVVLERVFCLWLQVILWFWIRVPKSSLACWSLRLCWGMWWLLCVPAICAGLG